MLRIPSIFTIAIPTIPSLLKQQIRNTFVLKRRYPPPLTRKAARPSKFRGRHFVYDLVEDQNTKRQPDLKVILTSYVEGIGNVGEVLSLRPFLAYRDYLMPGLAVYASPDNLSKYASKKETSKEENNFSSPYVPRTLNCLSRLVLEIIMNKNEPWKLEPWHIRTSFRKAGFVVPENTIEMPPIEIRGPDLSLQEKEFFVTVTVNNKEKVNVRCRIHHWATGVNRLPWQEYHWKQPAEPLLPEQADVLSKIPLPK